MRFTNSRAGRFWAGLRAIIVATAACGLSAGPAPADIIYWDGSGGTAGDWGSVANWSTVLAGGTNPAAIPGAADIATFSATPIQGTTQTVSLNGARSVLGLDFLAATIAATTLQGGGTNRTLTLGTSGITMSAGAGAVTIGSATSGQQVAITLGGAQSWTNNSSSLLTVTNGVTNGGFLLTVAGSGNTSILGIVAGTGGITKTGTGLLTVSGVNTYTGTTTLSAGTLRATTSASALGAGALSLGGGTLELANDTGLSFGRNTTVTANTAITADRLTSAGTTTTHTLGTLSIGAQTLTINRGGNITGTATGGITFGAATLTGGATFSPQANSLLTFSSTTALGANLFTKSGAGSMTLTGVVSGSTAVGSTSMNISNGLLTASGANTFTGNIAVSNSGVFAMAGATYTTTAPYGTVTGGTAYKQLLLTNGGTFRLTSGSFNNNAPTATNIAGGIIFNIGTGGATFDIASGASLIIDDGTGTGTATTASQLQGTGTITKTGLGTFQQDDSTAFAGAMIIAAGTFQPASGNAGGATSAGTTIQSGAQYNVNGITMTNQEPLTISGTGLAAAPAGALTNASGTAATWVGPITLGGAATIGSSGAGGLTLSSTATVNTAGNVLTLTTSGSGRIFTEGVISGTGSAVFTGTTSTGEYVPKADHTYSGGTTLSSGLVAVDRDSTGPAGSPTAGAFGTGMLTLAGSQLRAGTGTNRTVGNVVTLSADTAFHTVGSEKNLTFSGPVTLTGGNRTLTANAGTTVGGIATIFSGVIGDAGSSLGLIKAGTGNLVLSGVNTYTGGTTATAGTLQVTGSLANNAGLAITPALASGAVINFVNNAANTPATVSSLSLGSAVGTSFLGLDLGTASDSIVTSAPATASNAVAFHLNAAPGFAAGTYDLISAPSGLTSGGATFGLGTAPGGYTYAFDNTDSLVRLTATGAAAASRYWRGNLNASWAAFSGTSTTNWTTDAAGTTVSESTPGSTDTVLFSATSATGPTLTTTLDNPFTINDLQFLAAPAGVSSVAINPGINPATLAPGTLTLAPASGTTGLTLARGAGAVAIAAPITLGGPQTWSVDSSTPGSGTASSLTVSGAISGSAANGITFSSTAGTTPIVLSSAANTYSGASTISASTIVQGGVANGFSPNTAWTVGGTLNTGAFNQTTGSLAGGAGIVQNGSATNTTLTIGSDNLSTATFGGTIQNGSTGTLGLTKAGTGTQILSGTSSYTGSTTVTAGTLRIANASAYSTTSALVVNGTGTFDLFGNSLTAASLAGATTGVITNSSASTNASTATTPGTPSGAGIYVDALTGTAAANLPTATVTDGPTRKTQLVINNANSSTAFAGLAATTANTYSGGTVLATNNASGTRLTINATPTATPFGSGPIIIGQAATDKAGIFFSGASTFASPIVFNTALGSDRVGIRADAAVTLSGVITANLAPATFTANSNSGGFTLTNQITGPSGLVLDIVSSSAAATAFNVILNNVTGNASNYQGDTVINLNAATGKSATLTLGAANQIPNGAATGTVVINTNTTGVGLLNLNGFSDTINGLSGNGTVDGTSGTPTLTLGDNNATATFSGVIRNTAGTLTLTKTGTGTQTLSGASTFGGPVNVNGGLIAFATSPATTGPLGNSTVVNLNGGGISYTASGVNALSRSIAIGAGDGTLDVASTTGTLTVPGASVTSTGGSLVKTGLGTVALSGTTSLNGGAAGVVVNGGVLQAGFGSGGIGSITVGGSGNLVFQNGVTQTLTLGASGTVLTLGSGARLGFELDGSTSDSITVPTGGSVSLAGSYTFDFLSTGAGPSAATYTLLTAPAGSGLNTFTYTLGNAPLGYNYSFLTSDTQVQLQTVAYTPIYWTGVTDGSWATAGNFASDAAGTTPAGQTPLASETVIFSATSAVGSTIATTLDGSLTVDSLQFNGAGTPATSLVTVAQGTGGTLTLEPASASGGLAILAGGGSATISAPLTLDNTLSAGQAWNVVDASSVLTLSGNVAFGANVSKAGAGTVVLSGANSGSGTFNLNAGGLRLNSAGALGTGTLSIAAGTTLDNTSGGVLTLTGNGAVNINGDFTFTGSSGLGLGSGAVALSGNPVVTVAASSLTVAGAISGTSSLTKAGTGGLTLGGNNTFAGPLTLNAGTLNVGNAGALGAGTFVINGGTIDNTSGGPLTNAGTNPVTLSGSFAFTGTDDLNLGTGTIGLTATPTITVAAKTLTLAGNIAGGTFGLTKSGVGALSLAGTNTYTGNTTVNGGTLNVTGSLTGNGTTTAGSTLSFGAGSGPAIVNLSGTVSNYYTFLGATTAGAVAVYNQTGGTASYTATGTGNTTALVSNVAGGFGALNITGGTTNVLGRFILNRNGTAVGYVGGTGVLNINGEWGMIVYGTANTSGSLTIGPGGLVNRTGATNRFGIFMEQAGQYGVMNIAGGSFVTTTQPIVFGNSNGGTNNIGFLNLAQGTLQMGTNLIQSVGTSTGQLAYLNFAGGTLRATADLTAALPTTVTGQTVTATMFGPVDNSATVGNASQNFAGGLAVDTNGFAVTIAAPLVAATGVGVTQADIAIPTAGNSGYVAAPFVRFSTPAAGGVPASGYAVIGNGQVTGIVITNPGTYASGETPSITLTGGGGSIAAFNTAALNVANTAAGVTKTGAGTLTLSGANTYNGPTVITAGTLQLGAAGTSGSLSPSSAISTSGTLAFNRTDTLTQGTSFAATISGSGGLSQLGTGTVVLSGVNTYTGPTTLTAGTLSVADASNLGDAASPLVFDGGTLQITGTTLASLSGIGHAVSFNAGRNVGFDITTAAHTFTADQALTQGTGGLTKLGAGTLLLSQANTYTGTTTINQGTMKVTGSGVLGGAAGSIVDANNIVFGQNLNSGVLEFDTVANLGPADQIRFRNTGGTAGLGGALVYVGTTNETLSKVIQCDTSIGIRIESNSVGGSLTVNGALSQTNRAIYLGGSGAGDNTLASVFAGTGGLTKRDSGKWLLSGANTYTGATTINAGTLALSGAGTLGSASALTLSGGSLDLGTSSQTVAAVSITAAAASGNTIGNGSLTGTSYAASNATGNAIISANLLGTGTFTKTGAGTATLSGVNTYSGTTTIAQGTLAFTADQAMTGGLIFGAANGAANNGRLDLSTANATFPSLLVRTNSAIANAVTVGAGETLTINGDVTLGYDAGGGSTATRSDLTVAGAGGLAVTGTTITIGTNQAAVNAGYWNDARLDVSGLSSFTTNVTTFNVGVGTTTQGPGTLLLSDTANIIVATTLTAGDTGPNNGRGIGRIQLGAGTNVIRVDTFNIGRGKNTGPGLVEFLDKTAGSPGTVTITNRAGTGAANITVGDNNGTATGGGAIGTLDLRGHVANITAGTLLAGRNNMASAAGSVTSDVFFDAGTFTVNTLTMAQKTGAGTGGVTATLTIGGGSFTVNAGGAFTLGSQATAGSAAATLNLTGGTLTSNVDILDGGGAATSTINLSGGVLDMGGRSIGNATNVINNLTFASGGLRNVAEINGGANLTKTSVGTLALSGSSNYTGQTLVQAGTLAFDSIANVGAGASALGAPATTGNGTIAVGSAATGATLRYLGGTVASTDRVIDLAGTTGGVTLDSSGAGGITFASNLTASGTGSKTLTLTGTNTGANTLAGVIPNNSVADLTALAKTGAGRWVLSGANTYTGGTTISDGTLALSGAGTLGGGAVMVAGGSLDLGGLAISNVINFQSGGLANAALATMTNVLSGATLSTNGLTLGGTVNVTGSLDGTGVVGLIAGSGVVAPGNSPGILTASQLDFSGGIDQQFEFTAAGVDPIWSNAQASVNDVLRLMNVDPFNATAASGANVFDVYFNVPSLAGSEVFYGGIFTDAASNPLPSLTNATFNYYVRGDGNGTVSYKGTNYYTLAQYNSNSSTSWTVSAGAKAVPVADFTGGSATNGYVQMFAVPEPSTIGLLLAGACGLAAYRRARPVRPTIGRPRT